MQCSTKKKPQRLLTISNPKTQKGLAQGYLTVIMHFAPHTLSGFNVCPWADGCENPCLDTAGHGGIFKKGEHTNGVREARIRRTRFFFEDRAAFLAQLDKELRAAAKKADRMGLKLAFRPNGTSDVSWETVAPETIALVGRLGGVVYDYTKNPRRMAKYLEGRFPAHYSLTYSRGATTAHYREFLGRGNVAVVFRGTIPPTWEGVPTIDGDRSDLRFLDPRGVIVALTAKGRAKKDTGGFVVQV